MDTFLDYSQSVARELGLGLEELALLHYFVKTLGNTEILKCSIDGEVYFNVNYGKIISENPIFTFGKRMVAVKFGNLVNAGVLIHTTHKQGGTYSMYGFGKNYARLLKKSDGAKATCATTENSAVGGSQKIDKGVVNKLTTPSQKNDKGVVNKLTTPSQKIDELNNIYNIPMVDNNIDNNNTIKEYNNIKEKEYINNNIIYSCSEGQNPSEPKATHNTEKPFISLILNTKEYHHVYQSDVDSLKELYPAVDVEQEFRKMCGWCESNPTKRKTKNGIRSFINSWLSKAQDKAGNNNRSSYEPYRCKQQTQQQRNTGFVYRGPKELDDPDSLPF